MTENKQKGIVIKKGGREKTGDVAVRPEKKTKMQMQRKRETDSPCALLNSNLTRALK